MERPIRILLVEDTDQDAEFVLHHLKRAGLVLRTEQVWTLADVDRALASAPWDMVLCDYHLPGFTGLDAIRRVKAARPDLPVILVSGTVGEDKAVEAMRAGASDYVLKRDLTRLAPAVRRELSDASIRLERNRMEEREAHILSALPLVLFSSSGRQLTWISDNCFRLTGFPPERFLSEPDFWLSRLRPEDLRRLEERPLVGSAVELEVRWRCADDSWRSYMVHAQLREGGAFGLVLDVSDHRLLQQQLHQAQKMDSLGRLAGGVAHDFNNLLTAIRGFTDAALARLPSDEPAREDLREVVAASERAEGLTRRLLAFSRHQPPHEPGPHDVREILSKVERMLRPIIGEHVQFEVRHAAEPLPVDCEPGRLEQIVVNLVVNSRDAMPHGGRLLLETAREDVSPAAARHVPGARSGPHARLSVCDDGQGMDPETARSMFEPFFTTKSANHGTGLGLSIVHGIVQAVSGHVRVETRLGEGTSMHVLLPLDLQDRAPTPTPAPRPATRCQASPSRILVVEDERVVRTLAQRILEREGHEVRTAATVQEALALLEYGQLPDLVLTDAVLPDGNGPALAGAIRKSAPGVRFLLMSGYMTLDMVGAEWPPDAFLPKPFDRSGLIDRVSEVLARPPGPTAT